MALNSATIKSIQDIMRKVAGVDGDAQRLGQLTWLLFLMLKAFKPYFISNSSGAAQPNFSKEKIVRTPFPLPPLAEQRRIVGKVDQLLGLCDELAACQAAQREKRQRLVGATLDRLVATSLSRHPACRGGLTDSAPLDANSTGAEAVEPPGRARWRVIQDHAHRLRNHFDRLFAPPQLRHAILQLAVQRQLVRQRPFAHG